MNFESKIVKLNKSQQETYQYLSDVKNYEELMPEGADFSVHESGEGFQVQLKGLPKVGLKLKEKKEPEYILFESPSENFNYEMKVNISGNQKTSEVKIDFEGKFNPMISMMAKKPLTKFIENIADNLEKKA
ncbi:hypothetical protein GO491_04575 [Flavobacteriaceae bacterium Ap0902]|nr:hypothetical protein [Flavobacteriaceae bacterium Ap0902]